MAYVNALKRMAEVEQFPAAAYYSPLARGVLSGKYAPSATPPADGRAARNDQRLMQIEWRPESLVIAQKLKARAEALGMTASQFAMAWVLENRLVTSVICGPRTEAQLADYIGALGQRLPTDCEALVDSLVVPGHPSTPGYRAPMEPQEGRLGRQP